MKTTLYILIVAILGISSCIKNPDCIIDHGSTYEFDIPYTLSPVTDTFSVGDTIWIDNEFSNPLNNKINGKSYTLKSDFNFKNFIAIQDLKSDPLMPTSNFKIVNEDRSLNNEFSNSDISIEYAYNGSTFHWKKGIVITQSGWYFLTFGSDISIGNLRRNGQSITKCRNEFLFLNFIRTNGGKNAYLMQEAADEDYRNFTEEQMGNSVAFYVKD